MVKLTGYQILEQIYCGYRTVVYRGIREQDQKPVAIKLLQNEYPSISELVQFRNQYTITKNLNLPGIIKTYSLENYHNRYALVMEDFGGISLKEEMEKGGNSKTVGEFLSIAIQVVTTLEGLYRHRIIHKDIKPANILINPTTKEVRLIDFSIASLLPRETQAIASPNILEGTLAYVSPEQTGRMNRLVDYRTDFYSLGVSFYELLTGQLPFISTDPMELVHCHIAKYSPTIDSLNSAIPQVLCEIVSKLMAKNAEDRYQSAHGLRYDLEKCWQQWQQDTKIDNFEIGQRDICDRLTIPEKLYGRQQEVETLLTAFDRVSNQEQTTNKSEMMLVAGFSGIGKTAVVNEVHKPIVRQRGYFIKGKFDQFGRNIPFSAFLQAFRDLMGQLLSESNAQLEVWKTKILDALGENAQVLVEVIPELEWIIDKQLPVPELSGIAAQNRFNLLLQKFVQVFTTKEHPLVIFLDDLQWADLASLKLIQLLMSETNISYLLMIGAYRDNEVSLAHPLMLTLEEIRQTGAIVNSINLTPLNQYDLNHLVVDTLSCPIELALPLTQLAHQKTQGNPFFTNQFLKSLYEEGLITFNFNGGYWQCDIAQVKALALTDDVVEFMALQLQKLPKATQSVLKLAACIGNRFDLNTLAIVYKKSLVETAADLWEALQEGLVIPTSEVYKFFQGESGISCQLSIVNKHEKITTENEQLTKVTYRFLHDRVQQAAYLLIPENEKQVTHLQIGQLLLSNTAESELEEKIFEIVNQLNVGGELIGDPIERQQLAQLNLTAGRKAKTATAYAAAIKYLTTGIQLLPANSWQSQYHLTLLLHSEIAEATYLNGDFLEMEQSIETLLQRGKNLLDRLKAYEVRILSQIAQNKMFEALQTGLIVLKILGVEFLEQPTKADITSEFKKTQTALAEKSMQDLYELELMTEPDKLAVMNILSKIVSAAYTVSPELYSLIVFKEVNLSLQYGNTAISLYGYSNYGIILCAVDGDIEAGYQLGQMTLKLLDKLNAKEFIAKTYAPIYGIINHWKEHLKESLKPLQKGYFIGLETGDLEFTTYCANLYLWHSFFIGKELTSVAQEMAIYNQAIAQLQQEPSLHKQQMYWQVVLNLLSNAEKPCFLKGEAYNEEIMLPLHQQGNDKGAICYLYINKLMLCYLFSEYDKALVNAEIAENYLENILGFFAVPLFYFYDSLTQLALYTDALNDSQETILKRVKNNQEKMQTWAYHAPMNHLHKFYLVEAEKYRVLGKHGEAIDCYERAIAGAKENEYIQEEALSNELAAKFYLEWGKEKIAQVYLSEAYYCYARWGALARLVNLEKSYPQLLSSILKPQNIRQNSARHTNSLSTSVKNNLSTSNSVSTVLDLVTVVKASQAFASEIQLNKLISTLMQVVMENAGAVKSTLILLKGDGLVVEAMAEIGQENVLQSIPVEHSQDIPISLINYVSRTKVTVVFDDGKLQPFLAIDDGKLQPFWKIADESSQPFFAGDPYIIRCQPKSILCTPILNQGKLIGLLYLENNLTTGAFTSDRVEVLRYLCVQAAISLENAKLYQNLLRSQTREREKASQLEQSLQQLQQAQLQLVQNEKMATLGNLVAGVAHEVNNPLGFILGSLNNAEEFVQDLISHIKIYQQYYPDPVAAIAENAEKIDLDFLIEDLPKLISSMKLGTGRIRNISTSLRTFSRSDTLEKVACNIHEGIESTLLILKYRLKANEQRPAIEVIQNYGKLPPVKCFLGQLNQVFMNIIANAIDVMDEASVKYSYDELKANPNQITIRTEVIADENAVVIGIKDNGWGMTEEVKVQVFDHLFTTKSVGKGTGLGLSIARQIVEQTHGGKLSCISALGKGTEFIIEIPIS
ncbi:AAA family ATPase [Nostocaceae cyanobacterium CENA369]|uniref:histidine kinase n=1 Tax=Dendronalium phyllosphericum CENA369 TaxID=1725256 RepID=A0A8J7I7B0_9NOST|nr:ATP-binding sensor histidine kinase [Dendronalium phyllosphericum]MBH8574385.1 AAA family ATPase [Dendronalium phyllosphericum CENA369]